MPDSLPQLDIFKRRTLRRMDDVQPKTPHYSIQPRDLISMSTCPLCRQRQIIPITEVYLKGKLNFFSIGVCQNCGFVFRTVSPSHAWFQRRWKQIRTGSLEPFNPEVEEIRRRRYLKYFRILKKYKASGNLLDIGAANGTGSVLFRKHGYNVDCIEPEDNKARIIVYRHKLPLVAKSIEEFLNRSRVKHYDVVVFAHCLEHLDNPVAVIRKIRHIIKPDGFLYLEVPILKNSVTWTDALFLTHKSNFTEKTLVHLVKTCGFEILDTQHFRHSRSEPLDFGLILRPAQVTPKPIQKITIKDIDTIRNLYRKGLPPTFKYYSAKVIRYDVNAIEQFYCTLRLEHKSMKMPTNPNGHISFEPRIQQ